MIKMTEYKCLEDACCLQLIKETVLGSTSVSQIIY